MKYQAFNENTPIRICFLGCGKICNKHASTLQKISENFHLSFASRDIHKANEYKNKHKGQYAFSNYEDAINSENIDVIIITTPPDSHYELTKKTLLADKHVIIEKPPFYSSEEFEELGQLAESRNLQMLIAENYFYKPLRITIEKLLNENIIGKPLFININATKKQSNDDWRNDEQITKYGALFEGGIHWINFINNIGLQLKNERGFTHDKSVKLERTMQVTAESEEGTIVNLFYSWEVNTIFKGLRLSKIYGTEGSITFETNGLFVIARGKKFKVRIPDIKNITGFKLMFTDYLSAIRSGDPPALTWSMALKDLKTIEKVYASIK